MPMHGRRGVVSGTRTITEPIVGLVETFPQPSIAAATMLAVRRLAGIVSYGFTKSPP